MLPCTQSALNVMISTARNTHAESIMATNEREGFGVMALNLFRRLQGIETYM